MLYVTLPQYLEQICCIVPVTSLSVILFHLKVVNKKLLAQNFNLQAVLNILQLLVKWGISKVLTSIFVSYNCKFINF